MGEDKAGIVIEGQPLWKRQLAVLRDLNPSELFISGRPEGPYMGEAVEVVLDVHPGAGPLAGLEAALLRLKTPWLAVLAIDLPEMNAAFLARLLTLAFKRKRSIVPFDGEWFEPLAAIYTRAMLALTTECLRGDDHSMQHLAGEAIERGLAAPYRILPEEMRLFKNVNEPGDLIPPKDGGTV